MASFSDYLEPLILDHVMSDGAFTEPLNVYIALCTVIPTDASLGTNITEATYTGYARKEILATDLSAAAAGSKTNSGPITFVDCTAGTSTIVGFAVCDALATSTGNIIAWGTTTSKVINTSNTPPTIGTGVFVINLD